MESIYKKRIRIRRNDNRRAKIKFRKKEIEKYLKEVIII